MTHIDNAALLVGLNYIEATLKDDTEMLGMIKMSYSQEEIIIALTNASLALTAISSITSPNSSSYLDILDKARRVALKAL